MIDKLNESRTVLSTMYETENDIGNETTTGTTTQATTSCNSLTPIQSVLNMKLNHDEKQHFELMLVKQV